MPEARADRSIPYLDLSLIDDPAVRSLDNVAFRSLLKLAALGYCTRRQNGDLYYPGGWIPDNTDKIARILGVSSVRWLMNIRAALAPFLEYDAKDVRVAVKWIRYRTEAPLPLLPNDDAQAADLYRNANEAWNRLRQHLEREAKLTGSTRDLLKLGNDAMRFGGNILATHASSATAAECAYRVADTFVGPSQTENLA